LSVERLDLKSGAATAGARVIASKPAGRIIRADDMQLWESGAAYLNQAKQALEETHQQIPLIIAEERAKGYREGYDAGAAEVIELMSRMKAKAEDHYARLGQEIVGLVTRLVSEIIGDTRPGEAISATVLKAVRTLDLGSEFSLYVSPEVYDEVGKHLSKQLDEATRSKLLLRQDPKLSATGCRLVSEFGMIDLSIEKQLDILAASLRAAGVGIKA
jgi:type III secretion protein L